jgi:two-component system, NarL family, response regulator LiaR
METGNELSLTRRERTVMDLLSKGFSYKEIGYKLFISLETVKCHVKHIYSKLKVNNRAAAMLVYLHIVFVT